MKKHKRPIERRCACGHSAQLHAVGGRCIGTSLLSVNRRGRGEWQDCPCQEYKRKRVIEQRVSA